MSAPVKAVKNLAFLVAAFWMWQAARGVPAARLLAAVLAAIGVGSWLFHTHATVWAAILDTTPIAVFVLVYLYLINRDGWGLGTWPALGVTALFFPYAAAAGWALGQLPYLREAAGYGPLPILIAAYALAFLRRDPPLARGLLLGAGILTLSLTFRTVDEAVCMAFPLGTHFLWHLLNATMLGWMIHVYLCLRARQGTA